MTSDISETIKTTRIEPGFYNFIFMNLKYFIMVSGKNARKPVFFK